MLYIASMNKRDKSGSLVTHIFSLEAPQYTAIPKSIVEHLDWLYGKILPEDATAQMIKFRGDSEQKKAMAEAIEKSIVKSFATDPTHMPMTFERIIDKFRVLTYKRYAGNHLVA